MYSIFCLTSETSSSYNLFSFPHSQRGWTAWSVAATDKRVIATAPLVFSLLYFEESFMGHYRAMDAAWSFAFNPYYKENLTYYLNDPIAKPVYDIEDMFSE